MYPSDEIEEIKELMKKDSTAVLHQKLQTMHRCKLYDGLIVPSRRAQIDLICSLIRDELKERDVLLFPQP